MIYFLLPSAPATVANSIHNAICISATSPVISESAFVSHSMHNYLHSLKDKIISHQSEWNIQKKYTNPYEYLYSCPPLGVSPIANPSCGIQAASPFYFKCHEIYKTFPELLFLKPPAHHHYPSSSFTSFINIYEQQKMQKKQHYYDKRVVTLMTTSAIRTFHLSEEFGGSIEATRHFRKFPEDQHYTLSSSASESTEYIEFGADGTGNLLRRENFDECCAKYRHSMDVITAFAKNNTENFWAILWAQVCYAICMQKPGGHFILRVFDCFTSYMLDILYLLSGFYADVKIAKLQTSRANSSEKYIICQRFRCDFADYYPSIRQSFYQMLQINARGMSAGRFLNNTMVPKYFVQRIEEMNAVFGQPQLESIHYILSLINKNTKYDRNDQIVRQNVIKCINWCTENGIPYTHFNANIPFAPSFSEQNNREEEENEEK